MLSNERFGHSMAIVGIRLICIIYIESYQALIYIQILRLIHEKNEIFLLKFYFLIPLILLKIKYVLNEEGKDLVLNPIYFK